ncbi:MAG: MCE family protein [Candidatus Dadabacteria bacterium]|nr:MAG: MCE family protein [Candidatus Dadabacteria bacterium]
MSQKPDFFKIGLFVILALLLLAGAIILFGGGKFFVKKVTVETYFDQSVQGLSVGSALQFQGVQIGNVSYIGFVFNEYKTSKQYVLVRAQIYLDKVAGKGKGRLYQTDEERLKGYQKMVKEGLRLQLASQGVTGVAFLNAVYLDPNRFPPLEYDWKPEYPYIPSAPGTISQITETIEDLSESIDNIDFKQISDEIEKLVTSLNKAVEEAKVGELSKDLSKLIGSLNSATTELNTILKSKESKETLANITAITSDLKNTLNRTDRLLSSREHSVKLTLENIERISEDLREFMETIKKYPSWVLFGNPPPHIEEEEKPQ